MNIDTIFIIVVLLAVGRYSIVRIAISGICRQPRDLHFTLRSHSVLILCQCLPLVDGLLISFNRVHGMIRHYFVQWRDDGEISSLMN